MSLLSNPQDPDFKTQTRYYDKPVDMDRETAYEPYSHRGSDHEPLVQPRVAYVSKIQPPAGKRGLRRACVFFSSVSAAISLGILGVSIEVVITLAQTKTSRLLWAYNMMMQAWPLTGAPAVPTYVTISAAAATALLNIILLASILCGVSHPIGRHLLEFLTDNFHREMAFTPPASQVHSVWPPMFSLQLGLLQHW